MDRDGGVRCPEVGDILRLVRIHLRVHEPHIGWEASPDNQKSYRAKELHRISMTKDWDRR